MWMWRQLGSEVLKNFLTSLASVKGCGKEFTAYCVQCRPRVYINNPYPHVRCGHLDIAVGRRVGDMYSYSLFQTLPNQL